MRMDGDKYIKLEPAALYQKIFSIIWIVVLGREFRMFKQSLKKEMKYYECRKLMKALKKF